MALMYYRMPKVFQGTKHDIIVGGFGISIKKSVIIIRKQSIFGVSSANNMVCEMKSL